MVERLKGSTVARLTFGLTASILVSFLASQNSCLAKITLSGIFKDHMVIQQEAPVRIFGKAEPKEILGVKLGPENKVVVFADEKGNFTAELKPMKAGGPYKLTVVGSEKIEVDDILAGEVWLLSGQSNMELSCKESKLEDKIAELKFQPNVRFITLPPRVSSEKETVVDATWQTLDNDSASEVSAIATFFAQRVSQETQVPVGIIVSAVANSPIQPWISKECLESYPDGRSLIKKTEKLVEELKAKGVDPRNLPVKKAEKGDGQPVNADESEKMASSPYTVFNSMINPLVPFSIKGVVWYQGEADVYESDDYYGKMTRMIKDWRSQWKLPHLPFIYAQLPAVGNRQTQPADESPFAVLRDAQARANVVPYSYMAVTLDCSPVKNPDWHSANKVKIANRLAEIALATQYNKPYPYKSPSPFTFDLDENKVVIHFKNTLKNLKAENDKLEGFAISGMDKKLVWANAKIEGDSVIVWSDKVDKPIFVKYAWADNPKGNLKGGGNLPAVPFLLELE